MFFVDMLTNGHCPNKINRKIKTSVFILTHRGFIEQTFVRKQNQRQGFKNNLFENHPNK